MIGHDANALDGFQSTQQLVFGRLEAIISQRVDMIAVFVVQR
jgi:hypothetical protein